MVAAEGYLDAENTGELGAEDAMESPVSLLQRNVTLNKTPRAGGGAHTPLRHVWSRDGTTLNGFIAQSCCMILQLCRKQDKM